jgi:hypothetical protein
VTDPAAEHEAKKRLRRLRRQAKPLGVSIFYRDEDGLYNIVEDATLMTLRPCWSLDEVEQWLAAH